MKRIGKRGREERREREGGGAACVETRVALSSSMESCNIPGQGENLKVSIKREVKKRSATMKLSRGGEGREGGGGERKGLEGVHYAVCRQRVNAIPLVWMPPRYLLPGYNGVQRLRVYFQGY